MLSVVLLLGVASFAVAKIDTIGPCTANVEAVEIDFNQYSTENDGVWYFSKVTDTPSNSKFESLKSVSSPTTTSGVYDLLIYYKDKDGKAGIFANETVYGNNGPVVIAKGKDFDYTLKISFLKYEPGKYAYYYICSDDGGDTSADYRYIVANEKLSGEENDKIYALDKHYGFKGKLVDI